MANPYRSSGAWACPRCQGALHDDRQGSLRLKSCPVCRGIWLSNAAMTSLLIASPRQLASLEARDREPQGSSVEGPQLVCPRCSSPMSREEVGPKGDVHIDSCSRHGVWFDASELRAFVAGAKQSPAGPTSELVTMADMDAAEARRFRRIAELGAYASRFGPSQ